MLPKRPTAVAKVQVAQTALGGGLDLISPPGMARAGTCRFATNYEADFGGGYSRIEGFERLDGHTPPSRAEYVALYAEDGFGVTTGVLLTGQTSGAEGKVIYVSGDGKTIALTRLLPGYVFEDGEDVAIGIVPAGTITDAAPSIDPFLDNDLWFLAAEEYRTSIQPPPGDGPIRGIAVLNNVIYCWRDDDADKYIYKATSTGWQAVPLGFRVFFEHGTVEYLDDDTLAQGGVGAAIKRVVVTSGEWGAIDPDDQARGYFVVASVTGGAFAAAAAAGSGACELLGPQAPITLAAGGKVETVTYNFYGTGATVRLYGCDGVNPEFEFDGTTLVPIETGMGLVHATHVACHKHHLFYSFDASVQHSGTGEPFRWEPLFGAGELTTGDDVTNFIAVPGSEVGAALMITCRDSVHVLYGSGSNDWSMVQVSAGFGAQAYSSQPMFGTISFDREGFIRYSPTDVFGNFANQQASRPIEPLVNGAKVACAVQVRNRSAYRCFFQDGLHVTAIQQGDALVWMPGDYGVTLNVAVGAEIAGEYRVFAGSTDGWVYELDSGRNFDGVEVTAGLRLANMPLGGPLTLCQFRLMELQSSAASAFQLAVGAEFFDANADEVGQTITTPTEWKKQYGVGLFWDFEAWDRAYWDGGAANRVVYDIHGQGRSLGLLISSESDREAPHSLKSVITTFSPRRLAR